MNFPYFYFFCIKKIYSRFILKTEQKKYWLRFLISGAALLIIVYLFYHVLRQFEFIDQIYVEALNKFAQFLLFASKKFTELFGFEVTVYGKTIKIVDGYKAHGVYMDRGCMGRNVLLAFAGLIAVFPGKTKHKLWYIPMGLTVITFVNILRISGLAITAYCCPEYSDINHYLVFKIVAWIIIFILWMIWFNRFSPFAKKKNTEKTNINTPK